MKKAQKVLDEINQIDHQIMELLNQIYDLKEKRRILRQQLSQAIVQAEPVVRIQSPKVEKTKKIKKSELEILLETLTPQQLDNLMVDINGKGV